MNGIYGEKIFHACLNGRPAPEEDFTIKTIADITDDRNGSVPCNLGDSTIDKPVYGVDKKSFEITISLFTRLSGCDGGRKPAKRITEEMPAAIFGEQMIKFVLDDIRLGE